MNPILWFCFLFLCHCFTFWFVFVHVSNSQFPVWFCGSPEQNNTRTDNVYDRACIEAGLRAAISAAGVLGVDADRVARWQNVLNDLYDFPADQTTLWETPDVAHPYRCHPVVMFGVHPANCIEPGSELWAKP